ncbi:hypothetical protein NQ999_15115 [Acinetobacter baumannii]|uniref:hypothetical protein n=1 Tax=Acinetobacter baumannii TaxID=470 RepID=UPI000993F28B|nr:hypothetical protein [Acinetobacter baumannii]MBZ0370741.1 hypothetical protein [Acinetobacter baumannii]MDC5012137.1 hypothetical protein [Acinetobacter baumannii]MDP7865963.1 hypothetical protein [Acinetobacter baumannii]MDW3027556.1 hypothetical protein [Acinetobacter baumannii]OOS33040.1 hypothetical protein BTG56_01520 [Acinetobacter baumannii]
MKFRDFILNMTPYELEEYAKAVGTTCGYLKTHLLYGYKEPRKNLRKALAEQSGGKVSEQEVLQHFGLCPSLNLSKQNDSEVAPT